MDLKRGSACCACKLRTKSLINLGVNIEILSGNCGGGGLLKLITFDPLGFFSSFIILTFGASNKCVKGCRGSSLYIRYKCFSD